MTFDNTFAKRMWKLMACNVIIAIFASMVSDYGSLGLLHTAIAGVQLTFFAITMGYTMSYVLKDF